MPHFKAYCFALCMALVSMAVARPAPTLITRARGSEPTAVDSASASVVPELPFFENPVRRPMPEQPDEEDPLFSTGELLMKVHRGIVWYNETGPLGVQRRQDAEVLPVEVKKIFKVLERLNFIALANKIDDWRVEDRQGPRNSTGDPVLDAFLIKTAIDIIQQSNSTGDPVLAAAIKVVTEALDKYYSNTTVERRHAGRRSPSLEMVLSPHKRPEDMRIQRRQLVAESTDRTLEKVVDLLLKSGLPSNATDGWRVQRQVGSNSTTVLAAKKERLTKQAQLLMDYRYNVMARETDLLTGLQKYLRAIRSFGANMTEAEQEKALDDATADLLEDNGEIFKDLDVENQKIDREITELMAGKVTKRGAMPPLPSSVPELELPPMRQGPGGRPGSSPILTKDEKQVLELLTQVKDENAHEPSEQDSDNHHEKRDEHCDDLDPNDCTEEQRRQKEREELGIFKCLHGAMDCSWS